MTIFIYYKIKKQVVANASSHSRQPVFTITFLDPDYFVLTKYAITDYSRIILITPILALPIAFTIATRRSFSALGILRISRLITSLSS